jgi:uncharacterized membrane protein
VPAILRRSVRDAALLGAAAGLRTSTPFGALALRGRLGGGSVRLAAVACVVGELVIDKLPMTPSRTSPPGLACRLASAAVCGGLTSGAAGTVVGSAAACGAAFAGERTRAAIGRRIGLSDPLIALAEDALAIGIALAATHGYAVSAAGTAAPGVTTKSR